MLALLFNFAPLKITYLLAMPVAGLWIGVDSESRIGNGWLWGSIAFACPFLGVPLYYGLLLYLCIRDGRRNKELDAEHEQVREQTRRFKLMGEIERQQYLANAERSGGTLYGAQQEAASLGARHFTDERAEELLVRRQYEDAWDYLSDLYAVARAERDQHRTQTYLYYIGRLPDGAQRLRGLK